MSFFSLYKLRVWPMFVAVFLCSSRLLFAQEITFTATVDTNKITLGNSVRLVLTVTGKQQMNAIPQPVVDGFEVQYFGPETQVSVVNGNYSTSRSFIYTLFSLKAGQFIIPAITVNIEGKDYTTDPIELTVEDAVASSATQGNDTAAPSGDSASSNLQDKIMLFLQPEQPEVYLYQQIPVHAKLLVGGLQIDDIQYPSLDTTGFTMTTFSDDQYQQVLNGIKYRVFDFKTFITPTRTGDLTVGPARLQASLLSRMENQGAFGNNVFDTFFTTYQRRPFTVNSLPATIKVLPLPEEGKPEDFSGAVGAFDFEASISPIDVKVGDPITLRMKVTGQGDMKSITMPMFSDPSFKIYDPQIKDEANAKVLEQVIIPTSIDIKEVPAISFSYFDTRVKEYRRITKGPFSIIVTAPKEGEEFKVVGFETAHPVVQTKEDLGKGIIYIKERLDDLQIQGRHFYQSSLFLIFVILYVVGWLTGYGYYFYKRRLSNDPRFASKIYAPRYLHQGLEKANGYAQHNKAKDFYSTVVKSVTEYAGSRLQVPAAGLTIDVLSRHLLDKGIKDDVIKELQDIFETADKVRFASYSPSEVLLKEDYKRINRIIDHLEKRL